MGRARVTSFSKNNRPTTFTTPIQSWTHTSIHLTRRYTARITIENNVALVLDELTLREVAVQRTESVGAVVAVIFTEDFLNRFSRVWSVVCAAPAQEKRILQKRRVSAQEAVQKSEIWDVQKGICEKK